ncbi:energy-coupled thiamine transporter ThiT [Enterococcus faecalis]|nr:energy-coupled thiamine transporter ThiT [Enterococcus faecalis]
MDLRIWVEGTVVAAMAMALSFLPIEFANSGLDLSLGMVPLVLYSFRRGLLPGVAAGFVWGMYAPEGMSPYLYSFVLNGTSTVVNCLYVSLVLGLLAKVAPQLFVPKK